MTFYQEITLIPHEEITPYAVWSKLYNQLHIALADLQNRLGSQPIGVSFPNYQFSKTRAYTTLGHKLRVFAPTYEQLEALNLDKWLSQLADYLHLRSIEEVGDKATSHIIVRRYRKYNSQVQAKNLAKHKNINFEEALAHCLKYKQAIKDYPFIQLHSQSNGYSYRLYIQQQQAEQAKQGTFNTYGINNAVDEITVPHW